VVTLLLATELPRLVAVIVGGAALLGGLSTLVNAALARALGVRLTSVIALLAAASFTYYILPQVAELGPDRRPGAIPTIVLLPLAVCVGPVLGMWRRTRASDPLVSWGQYLQSGLAGFSFAFAGALVLAFGFTLGSIASGR
jgi:hypothetical protein